MILKLSSYEYDLLMKDRFVGKDIGGFQSFVLQLRRRIDRQEITIGLDDIRKIVRYGKGYGSGGYQARIRNIFCRHLGSDLGEKLLPKQMELSL